MQVAARIQPNAITQDMGSLPLANRGSLVDAAEVQRGLPSRGVKLLHLLTMKGLAVAGRRNEVTLPGSEREQE